jgi:UDP-N-acetylmuramate dehydrogenase
LITNHSLKPYNTFGIDIPADNLIEVNGEAELANLSTSPKPLHVLGGGSNVLLTQAVAGTVILNRLKGITQIKEDDNHIWLKVQSGEIWHEFVMYAIGKGLGGIENLALIPGTVGAAPIQNIGAYGVEAKETIETVTFWHWQEQKTVTYTNAQCQFGYRDSIFKHELKDKAFVTSVIFKLSKHPVFNTSYGAIEEELTQMGVTELSVQSIAQAVINIRTSKLPDPKQIGNAGSFFKNPTIPITQYQSLKTEYLNIPHYPITDTLVKLPAGWLIEQCGWKGYRKDDYGVHAKQALVLVNYGNAKGNEIWQLSDEIVASVFQKFGIELEREVQVW